MKVMIKKILAKILAALPTCETEQIASGITAYRYGNLVTILFDGINVTGTGGGYRVVGYTKFKPPQRVIYPQVIDTAPSGSSDADARLILWGVVFTDGSIAIWFNTSRTLPVRGSVSYIVGGVVRNILKALQSLAYRKAVVV